MEAEGGAWSASTGFFFREGKGSEGQAILPGGGHFPEPGIVEEKAAVGFSLVFSLQWGVFRLSLVIDPGEVPLPDGVGAVFLGVEEGASGKEGHGLPGAILPLPGKGGGLGQALPTGGEEGKGDGGEGGVWRGGLKKDCQGEFQLRPLEVARLEEAFRALPGEGGSPGEGGEECPACIIHGLVGVEKEEGDRGGRGVRGPFPEEPEFL